VNALAVLTQWPAKKLNFRSGLYPQNMPFLPKSLFLPPSLPPDSMRSNLLGPGALFERDFAVVLAVDSGILALVVIQLRYEGAPYL
jgi:hypothetical protein